MRVTGRATIKSHESAKFEVSWNIWLYRKHRHQLRQLRANEPESVENPKNPTER